MKFLNLVDDLRPMKLGLLMPKVTTTASVVRVFTDHCRERLMEEAFREPNVEL